MKITAIIVLLIILIVSLSCERILRGYKYNQGSLPEIPINLTDFNTKYDDYNSTAPSLGELIPFCFSTNRKSQGNDFDIIYMPMNVNFDKTSGILKVTNQYNNWGVYAEDYEVIRTGLNKIETVGNEFGPNLITGHSIDKFNFTLLYSTDVTGNSQINFVSNRTDETFSEPKEVEFLNSEFEDMYPAFNSEKSRIYFCSNRNGKDFDFYYVDVNPEIDIELLLSDNSSYQILMDSSLSSSSDDKCPFIFENKMVFASDRAGGFGGFDLYYSNLENGEWSEPINFGEKINTEFDEYRPILIDEGVSWTQTMMVFSSNRIGGKGGFDLYFVGIENE
ncbi:MAG TPA: hypothetical protein VMV47_09515 [Bacteroidales bacterium]|nr:hypothetical protein [Bacteroidales bacterium]